MPEKEAVHQLGKWYKGFIVVDSRVPAEDESFRSVIYGAGFARP